MDKSGRFRASGSNLVLNVLGRFGALAGWLAVAGWPAVTGLPGWPWLAGRLAGWLAGCGWLWLGCLAGWPMEFSKNVEIPTVLIFTSMASSNSL